MKRICSNCGRPPDLSPYREKAAVMHRLIQTLVLGDEVGDMMAYAICHTGFPMTAQAVALAESGAKRPCMCDLNVWNESIERYQAKGAKACWEGLGVTEEMMDEVRRANDQALAEEKKSKN